MILLWSLRATKLPLTLQGCCGLGGHMFEDFCHLGVGSLIVPWYKASTIVQPSCISLARTSLWSF